MVEDHILSAYDFQVYSAGGETVSRIGYRTNHTAATFVVGEPVVDDGTGEIDECADDPANVLGIAMESALSTSNRQAAFETNLADINTRRIVDIPTTDKHYIARYFTTDSTNVTVPTQANAIGITGGFFLDGNGNWYVDTNAGNTHVVITDVIDANGFSILDDISPSGAGDRVIFRFI